MITISMFNMLTVVAVALLIYAVIDYQNKMYAHIAMAFIAGFIFLYLGIAASAGIVYDPTGTSTNKDASLSVLFQFLAVASWVYTLLMASMAYFTWKRTTANRMAMQAEDRL